VLDKNQGIEERKVLYDILSGIDPKRTFYLTLELYRRLDVRKDFKGYQKNIHLSQDSEFLFFRDILRTKVYIYYLQYQFNCKIRLENLLAEKTLPLEVKEEIADICSSLTGPESIINIELPIEYKERIEYICRSQGISQEELMDKIVDKYLISQDEKDILRMLKHIEKKSHQ
jgi:hypothetical protein